MKTCNETPTRAVPGVAPAIPIHPEQLAIAHRLYRMASTVPPKFPVTVLAGDMIALLNGFWQESRRADQATARLEALSASPAALTPASAN